MGTPTRSPFDRDLAAIIANHDTPTKSKVTMTSPAILGNLKVGRNAVMRDLGDAIPQVPLQWFKDYVLPPLRSGLNIAALVNTLRTRGNITQGGFWSKFSTAPAKATPEEDVVFKLFEDIAQAVGEVAADALPRVKQSVVFKCNLTMKPSSVFRVNTSKPDGYGLYTKHWSYQEDGPIFWDFIVAPGEKKKESTWETINDNNRKITWSFTHIMREDACRRFVIGYTIENTNMRLWFCSRSDILVTEPFNFTKDHHTLTHFFVSLMYAKAAELGFDPTIQPARDPKARANNQYDITIRNAKRELRTYRTTRLISNIGAESVRGRGTRVWEAQRLVNGKPQAKTVALKDSWIDDDREREAAILLKIIESAATEQDAAILRKHFLSVEHFGDVYVDGQKDQTCTLLRRGAPIPKDLPHFVLELQPPLPCPDTLLEEIEGAPIGPELVQSEPLQVPGVVDYCTKAHHRVAFEEVGTTIDSLTSVHDILRVMAQAIWALRAIHASGWVHRDISAGNILIVDGLAKITDLEYAKKVDDESFDNLRMGTAYYMAIEADSHKYEFVNRTKKKKQVAAQDEVDSLYALLVDNNLDPERPPFAGEPGLIGLAARQWRRVKKLKVPFRHNALHDSEGAWWLLLRLTLDRAIVITGQVAPDEEGRAVKQRDFYRPLFQNQSTRKTAFMLPEEFAEGEDFVHPSMLPVARTLESVRQFLVDAYVTAEKDVAKIDHTVGKQVSLEMMQELRDLLDIYKKQDVQLRPLRPTIVKKTTPEAPGATAPGPSLDSRLAANRPKRRRDDDSHDAEPAVAGPSRSVRGYKRMKPTAESEDTASIAGTSKGKGKDTGGKEGTDTSSKSAKGNAKDTGLDAVHAGRGKARGARKRFPARERLPARPGASEAVPLRRSQRLANKQRA